MSTAGSAHSSAPLGATYAPPAAPASPAAPGGPPAGGPEPGGLPPATPRSAPRVRLFRWRGIVPLILLLALSALGVVLFGERVARETTEEAATRLLGTQVDVGTLRVRPTDAAIELRALAIADPFDRMRNLVEVARIEALVEPEPLLEKKVVVRRLRVRGVRLGTPRATAARPADPNAPGPRALRELRRWSSQFRQPVLAFTPIDTLRALVLDPKQLASVQAALALAARADSIKTAFAAGYAALRLAETVDSVQTVAARLQATDIRSVGLTGARRAVEDVRGTAARVDSAQRRVVALEQSARAGAALLRASLEGLDSARRRDYDFARGLLNLPRIEAPAIGGALFGEVSIERFQQALYWLALAEEHMPPGLRPRETAGPKRLRASGTTVHFAKARTYPRLHLRAGDFDVAVDDGAAAGRYTAAIADLTSDPALVGRPTRFVLRGAGLGATPFSLRAEGVLDHLGPRPNDFVAATVDGVAVPGFPLPGLHGRLEPGRAATRLQLRRRADQVEAQWTLRSPAVAWQRDSSAKGVAPPPIEALLWRVFSGINDVELVAALRGDIQKPELSVRSNLDRAVADRLKEVAGEEIAKAEAKARVAVDRLVEEKTAPVRAQVAAVQADANQRLADGRARLDAARARVQAVRERVEAQADSVARGALPGGSLLQKIPGKRLPKI